MAKANGYNKPKTSSSTAQATPKPTGKGTAKGAGKSTTNYSDTYNKVVKTAVGALAGPGVQAVKGVYNYFNPSTAKKAKEISAKKPSTPKKEKIYDLGVLPEHEVVANKSEKKNTINRAFEEFEISNKPLGSQGAENMKKAPIRPANKINTSPLPMRKDLKRNSVAMMKVKNPQKKY